MSVFNNHGQLSKLKSRLGLRVSNNSINGYLKRKLLYNELKEILSDIEFKEIYSSTIYMNDFIEKIPSLSDAYFDRLVAEVSKVEMLLFVRTKYNSDSAKRYNCNYTDLFARKVGKLRIINETKRINDEK